MACDEPISQKFWMFQVESLKNITGFFLIKTVTFVYNTKGNHRSKTI